MSYKNSTKKSLLLLISLQTPTKSRKTCQNKNLHNFCCILSIQIVIIISEKKLWKNATKSHLCMRNHKLFHILPWLCDSHSSAISSHSTMPWTKYPQSKNQPLQLIKFKFFSSLLFLCVPSSFWKFSSYFNFWFPL